MEQIIAPHENVLRILNKPKASVSGYRLSKYCVPLETEEGILLFNVLTRELVLLTQEEYNALLDSLELRARWFVIPSEINEREYADLVRWVLPNTQKKSKNITSYTILTTTDCNARCFYCYEKGCKPISMSEETARKVATYIKNHCGGEKVHISWFGGEPLVNYPVIDLICSELEKDGIEFSSRMISNGYLFSDEIVQKAVNTWKMKWVQITLDGTEQVYNRAKAFIYPEGSAYQTVLQNIERLTASGIAVHIRMNLGLHNADDLMALTRELDVRFPDKRKLSAYSHLLFEIEDPNHPHYTDDHRHLAYQKLAELEDLLASCGLSHADARRLKQKLTLKHCMADSDNAIVIVPDGHLGKCEHFCESDFWGHIDSEEKNTSLIASWRVPKASQPLCENCFYYPECVTLKKCPDENACTEFHLQSRLRKTRQAMRNELRLWLQGNSQAEEEDTPLEIRD